MKSVQQEEWWQQENWEEISKQREGERCSLAVLVADQEEAKEVKM